MKKEKKTNVIPLIRDSRTRSIVKDQFDNPIPSVQDRIDRINNQMDELRQMAERHAGLESYGELPESTLPREEELEKEYRRKQDEAKKKREQNNRSVTRTYGLLGKGEKPPRK